VVDATPTLSRAFYPQPLLLAQPAVRPLWRLALCAEIGVLVNRADLLTAPCRVGLLCEIAQGFQELFRFSLAVISIHK
jgi:hypothetical protein